MRDVVKEITAIEKIKSSTHCLLQNFMDFYEMYDGSERRTTAPDKNKKNKVAFVMPCQHENCEGFLSECNYKCGICSEICAKNALK